MASGADQGLEESQQAPLHGVVPEADFADAVAAPFSGIAAMPLADMGQRLSRLDPATRARIVARMQRGHGNQYVQQLARQDHGTQQAPPPVAGAAGARPDIAGLRTLADSYINSQYASAARDGLSDAEAVLGNQFDYGSFLTALAGNLIWAAACFSTGGTAFVVSVAGIAVGAAAPSGSTNIDRAGFHAEATRKIDGIVTHLLNQIDRVTRDVDAVASECNLSDSDTRRELLQRLLKPEYIQTVQGGLPAVNRSAIANRIETVPPD